MDDDNWGSEFLSTRHVHNRGSRRSNTRGSKGHHLFDVKKTFGSYELKCPVADRYRVASNSAITETENQKSEGKRKRKQKAKRNLDGTRLEIYRLTEGGDGLIGELIMPGMLEAGVILAATKKGLEELKNQKQASSSSGETAADSTTAQEVSAEDNDESQSDSGDEDENSDSSTRSEDKERRQFEQFEKNSFRQPKFWLWWKGVVCNTAKNGDPWEEHSGIGYVVFSGNACRRFEGTLSCELLEWKDVAVSGWKLVDTKERDIAVRW